jgi:tripeptidyl-peptidase I
MKCITKIFLSRKMRLIIVAYVLLACTCHAIQNISPSHASEVKASEYDEGSNIDGSNGCLHVFREDSVGLSSHGAISKVRRALSTQIHVVIFTVRERNMDVLKTILHQISDPKSKRYGDHMTKQEVNDLTYNADSHNNITKYLHASGAEVHRDESMGNTITARAPVGTWERIFNTEFNVYSVKLENQDVKNGDPKLQTFIRSEKYSVPSKLHKHIASVLNTVQLPPMIARSHLLQRSPSRNEIGLSSRFSQGGSNTLMNPKRLNEVYNIDDNTGHPKATQAIFGTSDFYFSPEDITRFQVQFNLPLQSVNQSTGNSSVSSAWCRDNAIYPCVDGNLQVQYMMAMCSAPTTVYYSDYLTHASWLQTIYNSPNTPLIATMTESYPEEYVSLYEVEDFENWAVKLGAIGVTVIVASGDDGAALPLSSVGRMSNSSQCRYTSIFPASCPYVLSVGATQVHTPVLNPLQNKLNFDIP